MGLVEPSPRAQSLRINTDCAKSTSALFVSRSRAYTTDEIRALHRDWGKQDTRGKRLYKCESGWRPGARVAQGQHMEDVALADLIPFDQPGFSLPLARFASTGHIYPIQPAKRAKVISKAPVVGGVSTPHTGPLEHFPTGPTDTLVMLAPL